MTDFYNEINEYLEKLKKTIDTLKREEINNLINLLIKARDEGRMIYIMGNGGSAATASHFCCDFNKGASYGYDKRFKFICLNDNMATISAYSNDVNYDEALVEQLKNFLKPGDLVIGISGSGNSINVVKAIEYANQRGAVTVCLVGYSGGKLKEIASHSVHVNINDMQISEDLHMILCHLLLRVIKK